MNNYDTTTNFKIRSKWRRNRLMAQITIKFDIYDGNLILEKTLLLINPTAILIHHDRSAVSIFHNENVFYYRFCHMHHFEYSVDFNANNEKYNKILHAQLKLIADITEGNPDVKNN